MTDTLQLALAASGCDQAPVVHKPRLLSDNGSSYVSADLAEWVDDNGMEHVRGAPLHPQTRLTSKQMTPSLRSLTPHSVSKHSTTDIPSLSTKFLIVLS